MAVVKKIFTSFIVLLLAFTLAISPFTVKRANALVPVAVGGAAALAAELGISEAALWAGACALMTAGTGIYFAANAGTFDDFGSVGESDPTVALPGFDSWNDASADDRVRWGTGADGNVTADNYYANQRESILVKLGLVQEGLGGGTEPTPPPTDPDERAKWQKKRNVIALLATGGVVTLADAVSSLGQDFIDSLFAPDTNDAETSGFGMSYIQTYATDAGKIKFKIIPTFTTGGYSQGYLTYTIGTTKWQVEVNTNMSAVGYTMNPNYAIAGNYNNTPNLTVNSNGTISTPSNNITVGLIVNNEYGRGASWSGGLQATAYSVYNSYVFLNANYGGTYTFPGGLAFTNGLPNQDLEGDKEYGQIVDTPQYISENINNYGDLINNVNYNQEQPDDNKLAVTLPSNFTGPDETPDWHDYVEAKPENEIDVPSETEPYDPSNPTPTPTPNWDFDSNLSAALGSLSHAFTDALFPFCLIGDIRDFAEKISTSMGFSGTRGTVITQAENRADTRTAEQYTHITLAVNDFNVDGLNTIEFDLSPILALGNLARPWWTVLLIAGLLGETIRYFLK